MRFNIPSVASFMRGAYTRLPEPPAHDLEAGHVLPSPDSFELDAIFADIHAADTLPISGPLGKLPHEVFVQVCRYLDPESLAQLCDASRGLREVASDPVLWQPFEKALADYPVHLAPHWRSSTDDVQVHAKKRRNTSIKLGVGMAAAYVLVNLILFARFKPSLKMPAERRQPATPGGYNPISTNLTEADCLEAAHWGYMCASEVGNGGNRRPTGIMLDIPTPDPEQWGIERMDHVNASCIEEFKPQSGDCRKAGVWDDPLNWCSVPREKWPPLQSTRNVGCYRDLAYQHAYADFQKASIDYAKAPEKIRALRRKWLLAGLVPLIGASVGLVPPVWVAVQRKRDRALAKARESASQDDGAQRKRIMLQAAHAKKLGQELHAVIARRDIKRLSGLLDTFPIASLADAQGRTPLQRAVGMNDSEMLRVLVKHGVKVLTETLIDDAIINNRSPSVIELLFSASSLSAKPLHVAMAVRRHDEELVDVLLRTHTDPEGRSRFLNASFKDQMTPLHIACETDAPITLIETLLENGADANASASFERMTPLHRAVFHRNRDLVELLLSYGACTKTPDIYGNTPLRLATYAGPAMQAVFAAEG
jgi:hypothetical protein